METKTLIDLGIPTFHLEKLHWRRAYNDEVKSGELIGKQFKTRKGKTFICKNITLEYIYFGSIEMQRKYALFLLPTLVQLTTQEQIEELKIKYPNSKLHIPKVGCQLHGDITATLTLENGTMYEIPWNY